MNSSSRTTPFRLVDWLVPAGLLLLSGVPVVGGGLRLLELSGGPVVLPDGARVLASPVPGIPYFVFDGLHNEWGRALTMGAGPN